MTKPSPVLGNLTSTNYSSILQRVTPLLPSILQQPTRSLTYFGVRSGKRKSVKAVPKRFMRLHCGLWIRKKAGYKKKLWKKMAARKKRLREVVLCNKTQSKLLDKMTTSFWKRRNWLFNPDSERQETAHLLGEENTCWCHSRAESVRYLSGSTRPQEAAGNEDLIVPKKKTWDKTAVLQALAYTVNHDPTAPQYMFQDDPFLIPKTSSEFRIYSLSKESGRNAAKYIFKNYPNLFLKDIAEPHIPCLMPESLQPQIEEVSEEALSERILLRRVKDSVDLFDQLLQGGTTPSIETTNKLLDLLCFYGDREPDQVEQSQSDESENGIELKKRPGPFRKNEVLPSWRQNNNAERIFNLMSERNAHTFCTMIRGMVKYGASSKAFDVYTDLLNNRMTADVHTFNALILAAPELKDKYNEKLDLVMELLKHMVSQKVQPNLLTFNCVLNSLRKCGSMAKGPALQTLNEMKALNVEPSLATFYHLMGIFYKPAAISRGQVDILAEILHEVEGKSFTAQDPDDVYFFSSAMRVCLDLKDVELAYKLHGFLETGDNWKLIGDQSMQSAYYGRFFNLICLMEHIDVILKWYRELIPSRYFPNHRAMMDVLQALEMESRLDLLPQIWKDIKQLGHSNRQELVEELLSLMARNVHLPELQTAFVETAVDIKSVYDTPGRIRVVLEWSAGALGNVTLLLARAGRLEEAWNVFRLFKTHNRVPRYVTDKLVCHRILY
ncbi:pentatricopeptide repeat domain-containing 3, mitochondrial isoform X1 [Pelobates cultripes]|uniref:Small ribosomal subunit protein mS39 n=1 Tax=Pelobates cultripes TaxID=61616 RepID=A0AAD1WCH4_PELCU|nr:pentatricopeptide repeat domain-containing 3, mitochondrial isoform X1 [Pelobates cultripes]